MIVGLAPAAHGANRTGRMFTGDRSGDFLYAALHRAGYANQPTSTHRDDGLELRDCFITAPVKCAPPANKPLPAERDDCAPWLHAELRALRRRARAAVPGRLRLGRRAARARRGSASRSRGRGRASPTAPRSPASACTLLGCFHVSQQNTFTGRLTPAMLDAVLARARMLARNVLTPVTTLRCVGCRFEHVADGSARAAPQDEVVDVARRAARAARPALGRPPRRRPPRPARPRDGVRKGRWDADADAELIEGGIGFLVLDGALMRCVTAAHRTSGELLGAGRPRCARHDDTATTRRSASTGAPISDDAPGGPRRALHPRRGRRARDVTGAHGRQRHPPRRRGRPPARDRPVAVRRDPDPQHAATTWPSAGASSRPRASCCPSSSATGRWRCCSAPAGRASRARWSASAERGGLQRREDGRWLLPAASRPRSTTCARCAGLRRRGRRRRGRRRRVVRIVRPSYPGRVCTGSSEGLHPAGRASGSRGRSRRRRRRRRRRGRRSPPASTR